ncbi:Hypothetical protein A7982_09384 [Minicystis rosea]|nr:Hypothetical protein A7982_09384 [Minicystis rosea]
MASRAQGSTLLILTDGNTRGGGGYAEGARKVVSIAEHLARRGDVATMVACILSPDNVAKRSDRFFHQVYKAFIHLGVAVHTRGALVAAGVRAEVSGDLRALHDRGGRGADLADAIEAVTAATAQIQRPALRLLLGVGYGPDIARELGVDILLRTGMEEPGTLRLSGLHVDERIACFATTTLWPEMTPHDIDEVLALGARPASARFAPGYELAAITDLVLALATASLEAPVHASIPAAASMSDVAAALDRLYDGPLQRCTTLAVELDTGFRSHPRRYGPEGALHEIRVVRAVPRAPMREDDTIVSVLAPGQAPPSFTLPAWLPLDHANAHACAPTAEGMVAGIRAALRFSSAHPPLHGGDRATPRPSAPADGSAWARSAPPVPPTRPVVVEDPVHALEDPFIAETFAWAASAGVLLPSEAWRCAATSYALTALYIHHGIPTEWDATGADWGTRATLAARYMILVAAGDEAIFDAVMPGETEAARRSRLEASARFLRDAVGVEGSQIPAPPVPGAEMLGAIATQWRALLDEHARACLPAAAASFRAGLADLYAASVAEHRADLAADPFARGRDAEAVTALVADRFAASPACVAQRAEKLAARIHDPEAEDELRVLLYLTEAGSAIGAGLLFRAAALAAPAKHAAEGGVALLEATATLLDLAFRLDNDRSGFLDAPGGDRDPKQNACSILLPAESSGPARAARIVAVMVLCQRLADWLARELGAHLDRLSSVWPSMGEVVRRGVLVGRRVYEKGHYTTLSRAEMRAIFAELPPRPKARDRRAHRRRRR